MALQTAVAARIGTRVVLRSQPARRQRCAAPPAAAKAGATAAPLGRDATGIASLRLAKPSAADMDALMQDWRRCGVV